MKKLQWGDEEGLKSLLLELVSWDSLTGTEGEQQFSHRLQEKCKRFTIFRKIPIYCN